MGLHDLSCNSDRKILRFSPTKCLVVFIADGGSVALVSREVLLIVSLTVHGAGSVFHR
jgi:hypothetical protein